MRRCGYTTRSNLTLLLYDRRFHVRKGVLARRPHLIEREVVKPIQISVCVNEIAGTDADCFAANR